MPNVTATFRKIMSIRETPSPRNAVFFDLDGTLADSLDMLRGVYSRFLLQSGAAPDMAEFETINGVPLADAVAMLKEKHRLKGSVEELAERYLAAVEEEYAGVVPVSGAKELLEQLHWRGWFLALVTSNNRVRTKNWLSKNRLAQYFSALVCAEDIARAKPDPEPYLKALSLSGIDGRRAWVVEDAELGVRSAMAAGLRTIYVGAFPLAPANDLYTAQSLADVLDILDDRSA